MKKTLWMLGVAVAALTSCTQSEVVDIPESRIIQFDTFVGKSTRAAIPINQYQDNNQYDTETPPKSNLYQFWVFGTQSDMDELKFDGTDEKAKVYFHKANNTFLYDNHLTWKFGETYNFAAYSNGNKPLVENAEYNTPVTTPLAAVTFGDLKNNDVIYGSKLFFDDYTVGDMDLLAAIAPTTTLPQNAGDVTPVPLYFEHMLALVNIRLENNTEDLHMQIADMTFNAITKDDCSYMINVANSNETKETRTIVWENMDSQYGDGNTNDRVTSGTYTFKGTAKGVETSNFSTDPNDYLAPGQALELTYFVIPQDNQNIKNIELNTQSYHRQETVGNNEETTYTYTLSNNNGSIKTHKVSLAVPNQGHTSWQPGYRYSYTGSLSGNAHFIHFAVMSVTDWSANNTEINGSVVTE